jgi:hypothetical protein
MKQMKGHPIRIIKKYPLTQTILFENLQPEERKTYRAGRLSFRPQDSLSLTTRYAAAKNYHGKQSLEIKGKEFSPYFSIPVSGMPKNIPLRIEVDADIWCAVKPMGDLAVALYTPVDSQYHWNARLIERAALAPERWTHITYIENLPKFISVQDSIRVYLWNTGTQPIYLSDMRAVVAARPSE